MPRWKKNNPGCPCCDESWWAWVFRNGSSASPMTELWTFDYPDSSTETELAISTNHFPSGKGGDIVTDRKNNRMVYLNHDATVGGCFYNTYLIDSETKIINQSDFVGGSFLAVGPNRGYVFIDATSSGDRLIHRFDYPAGTNKTLLHTLVGKGGPGEFSGMTYDDTNNILFWAERTVPSPSEWKIFKNGSAIYTSSGVNGLEYDHDNDVLYFAEPSSGTRRLLRKINPDGSGVTTLIDTGGPHVRVPRFSHGEGKVYYVSSANNESGSTFRRINPDGTGDEEVSTGVSPEIRAGVDFRYCIGVPPQSEIGGTVLGFPSESENDFHELKQVLGYLRNDQAP